MFVSQERGAARKPFQKPNILRRKTKGTKLNIEKNHDSCDIRLPLTYTDNEIRLAPLTIPVLQTEEQNTQQFQIVEAPTFTVVNIEQLYEENQPDSSRTVDINGDSITIYAHNAQIDSSDLCSEQNILNVESFLNNDEQSKMIFNIDGTSTSGVTEADAKTKWSLDFVNDNSKETLDSYDANGSQVNNVGIDKSSNIATGAANMSVVGSFVKQTDITLEYEHEQSDQNLTFRDFYKQKLTCEEPNCNKSFWTEASLEKHKKSHTSKSVKKSPVMLHCPVTRTESDGAETRCSRTFPIRKLLMKHLNEDHSAEDALYKCTKCERRFFWAGGARLHQASECGRLYACVWPGCGRVFRQPCRLREHARAHTGDRPYACHHPGCGWSFRSNSKLVRHARRHTGERRHVCAACGRAFLRREHLRDHAASQHPAHKHRCTHEGCERSFFSTSSLVAHVKNIHLKQDGNGKPQPPKRQRNSRAKKDMLLISAQSPKLEAIETSLVDPCEQILDTVQGPAIESVSIEQDSTMLDGVGDVLERDSVMEDVEDRCARTHCTWPLQRPQDTHYELGEDAQVEQAGSESMESNIYTVRSDLFLHGNLLINEDSEFIMSRAGSAGAGGEAGAGEEGGARGGAALDALGLIDSHPTVDLTQEELMYADAVDESSFRVFLLNGEELS